MSRRGRPRGVGLHRHTPGWVLQVALPLGVGAFAVAVVAVCALQIAGGR